MEKKPISILKWLKFHKLKVILYLIFLIICFLSAILSKFGIRYNQIVAMGSICYIALVLYSLKITTLNNILPKKFQILTLLFTFVGSFLFHQLWENGPWHFLAVENDGMYALSIAKMIKDGDLPFSLFTPLYWGRVSFVMCIESLFMFIFSYYKIHYYFLIIQTLSSFLFCSLIYHYFFLIDQEKIKILNIENNRFIIAMALVTSFCPYVFLGATCADMYQWNIIYTLGSLIILMRFVVQKNLDYFYPFFSGFFISSGLFISPSTKFLCFIFIFWMIYHHKKISLPLFFGILPSILIFVGFSLGFKDIFNGRELYIFQTNFLNRINAEGWFNFSINRILQIKENLWDGLHLNLILLRSFQGPPPFASINFFSILALAGIFYVKKIRPILVSIFALVFLQIFVATSTDYRIIHLLPLLLFLAVIFNTNLYASFLNSKFTNKFYPAAICILLTFSSQIPLIYGCLNVDYSKRLEWGGKFYSMWPLVEIPKNPKVKIWTIFPGAAELTISNKNIFSANHIQSFSTEQQIQKIQNYLLKNNELIIRTIQPIAKEWQDAYKNHKFMSNVIISEVKNIRSEFWQNINEEAIEIHFKIK